LKLEYGGLLSNFGFKFDLRRYIKDLFAGIPEHVDTVVFPNYEAVPEVDTVRDPFREVTLFKRNFDHVVRETYMAGAYTRSLFSST